MFLSRFLVFLQFSFLALLCMPFYLIPLQYAWIVSFISISLCLKLLIWTSYHNKIGNFNIVPEIKEGCELIQTGPYRFIRHPMYTAIVLAGLSAMFYGFALFKLVLMVGLVLVLFVKAKREEKFWCEHTLAYTKYQKNTKMFIPFVL